MINKKVSVIVPFYNTNIEYYRKCQESICLQSYKNIEIIIIDDGSQVEYAEQIDKLSQEDNRIKIIHKENGGVSSARNLGIKVSTGYYITFVDSDDWIEPTFIETLINNIEQFNAQIASVGVIEEYNNKETEVNNSNVNEYCLNKQDLYVALLSDLTDVHGYLWNKIYKRDFIKQFLNEKYHYCEDLVFNAHYIKHVQTAIISSSKLYHYRLGTNNATNNTSYNHKILTLIEAYREVEKIYQIECPKKLEFIQCAILKQALNIRARYKINRIQEPEKYLYLEQIIKEYWEIYKKVTVTEKINIQLTYFYPKFIFKLKRIILNIKKR